MGAGEPWRHVLLVSDHLRRRTGLRGELRRRHERVRRDIGHAELVQADAGSVRVLVGTDGAQRLRLRRRRRVRRHALRGPSGGWRGRVDRAGAQRRHELSCRLVDRRLRLATRAGRATTSRRPPARSSGFARRPARAAGARPPCSPAASSTCAITAIRRSSTPPAAPSSACSSPRGPAPAVDASSRYILAGSTLRAEDVASGSTRWSFSGDGGLTSAPIVAGATVFVGLFDRRPLRAVDGHRRRHLVDARRLRPSRRPTSRTSRSR